MFKLIDTFNCRTISTHRTLDAAVAALAKHSRMIRKTQFGLMGEAKELAASRRTVTA